MDYRQRKIIDFGLWSKKVDDSGPAYRGRDGNGEMAKIMA